LDDPFQLADVQQSVTEVALSDLVPAIGATTDAAKAEIERLRSEHPDYSASKEHELFEKLEDTVRGVHEHLLAGHEGKRGAAPATTLTMVLLIWPRAYLIHVGDSRAYVRRHGKVQQLTRDQTFGEYMVNIGAWTEEQASRARPAATLASAIGGTELTPVVGLIDLDPGDSLLLCTDGLTKHVPDERIAAVLGNSGDAESMGRQLVADALAEGGTDNIAVIVVRSSER
jgi:protein phosphatase